MPDAAELERTRTACRQALYGGDDLRPLSQAGGAAATLLGEARTLLPAVRASGEGVSRLAALEQALAHAGVPVEGGAFERFLIVSAAADAIDRVPQLAVDEHVRRLLLQAFESYAAARVHGSFDLARGSFVAMAQIATLSRFPAGQLDWVVSGIPRSWMFRVPWHALPGLARSIVFELGGFAPAFFSHLNPNRRNRHVLLERESLRAYHRMARSMALQPAIRGLVTASWFHSPDTFAVSPHLSWLNRVFLENGGHVVPLGRADVRSGVLHRSPERQKAYDAGTFTPTEALVIWPRAAMLAWADGHADLSDHTGGCDRVLVAQGARA